MGVLGLTPFSCFLPDKFIQKTRKLYLDTRTQRNLSKLNSELNEVQSIMTKNIQEVLGQGEKLESKPLASPGPFRSVALNLEPAGYMLFF